VVTLLYIALRSSGGNIMFIPLVGYLNIITQLRTFCMSAENRSAAIVVMLRRRSLEG
jgi:hypothetical protein